ncbi:MAG: hypothetical protein AAF125_10115, partial [Chloroflexota bacterium]
DNLIYLWDVASGEIIHELAGHSDWVNSLAFSPDGTQIVSTSLDPTVYVWDVETGERRYELVGHLEATRDAHFSPDGTQVATVSDDESVFIWDLATESVYRSYETTNPQPERAILFEDGGSTVVTGGGNGELTRWRIQPLEDLKTWTEQNRFVPALSCDLRESYGLACPGGETGGSSTTG